MRSNCGQQKKEVQKKAMAEEAEAQEKLMVEEERKKEARERVMVKAK